MQEDIGPYLGTHQQYMGHLLCSKRNDGYPISCIFPVNLHVYCVSHTSVTIKPLQCLPGLRATYRSQLINSRTVLWISLLKPQHWNIYGQR